MHTRNRRQNTPRHEMNLIKISTRTKLLSEPESKVNRALGRVGAKHANCVVPASRLSSPGETEQPSGSSLKEVNQRLRKASWKSLQTSYVEVVYSGALQTKSHLCEFGGSICSVLNSN